MSTTGYNYVKQQNVRTPHLIDRALALL